MGGPCFQASCNSVQAKLLELTSKNKMSHYARDGDWGGGGGNQESPFQHSWKNHQEKLNLELNTPTHHCTHTLKGVNKHTHKNPFHSCFCRPYKAKQSLQMVTKLHTFMEMHVFFILCLKPKIREREEESPLA